MGKKSTTRILKGFFGYVPETRPDKEFIDVQEENQRINFDLVLDLGIRKRIQEKLEVIRTWAARVLRR